MIARLLPMRAAAFAIAIATVVAGVSASATVVVPLTRARMVQESDLVVRALVLEQRFQWNEDHSQILTLTRLRVTEFYKGGGTRDLVLRQFGGRVEGLSSEVPGDGHLSQGQDVVLFLRSGLGVVYLTSLAQTLYTVTVSPGQPPVVHRDLTELAFAVNQNGRMVVQPPPPDATETVDHLAADVRALAAGAR